MIPYLILFLLFFLQFIYFPAGTSFFEGSKVIVAEAIILFLLFLRGFFEKNLKKIKIPSLIKISFATIFIVSAIHLFINNTPTILFGNQFRMQGTLLLWFLLAFSILSSDIRIDGKIKQLMVFTVIALQFVFSLLFIGVGFERPVGSIGEPNALAANAIFLWPFLFFPLRSGSGQAKTKDWMFWIFASLGMIMTCVIILVTGSRSGVIALGVQMVFLYLFRAFYGRSFIPTILSVALLLLSLTTVPVLSRGDKYENRAEIWQSAWNAVQQTPVLGVGFGNAEYAIHEATVRLFNHLQEYYVDSAHNIFLDYFLQGGIMGLIVLLLIIASTLRSFIVTGKTRNLVLFLGLITSLSFNPASVVSLLAFWWLIGQGFAPHEHKTSNPAS